MHAIPLTRPVFQTGPFFFIHFVNQSSSGRPLPRCGSLQSGMATYLFKTEPSEYSFENLMHDEHATWDGVSNAQALAFLRQAVAGDDVLIYETGGRKAIVGLAEIVSDPREDPERPGLNNNGDPRFPVVDVSPVKEAVRELPLDAIKSDTRFKDLPLVRQPRLSVMLIPDDLALELKQLTGLTRTPARRR